MTAQWAIRLEGIGKQYRRGASQQPNDNLREDVMNWARRLVAPRSGERTADSFWALKDIDLEIPQGETVGIIGRNGAGKSTLLKVLSRITPPTTGQLRYRGRLASLLEVGTGFHRELTGRENIYLNGAILGMRRHEINRHFNAIVEFAEIGEFLDTPVKFYSSGMYVRLAFSVAAHLQTDILVVDEVLAVGDAAFQRKCLGKMGEVASQQGRTVFFVSHNMAAVQNLCKRGVLLKSGSIVNHGPVQEVTGAYTSSFDGKKSACYGAVEQNRSGVTLRKAELRNDGNELQSSFRLREPINIRMEWNHKIDVPDASYSIRIFRSPDVFVAAANTIGSDIRAGIIGNRIVNYRISPTLLAPGEYSIQLGCHVRGRQDLELVRDALALSVIDLPLEGDPEYHIKGSAMMILDGTWIVEPN